MFSYVNTVGRLVEFRMATPITHSEIASFVETVNRVFARRPGKFVCASDFRGMNVLAPDVAERLLGVMKQTNERIERNGFFISDSAIFSLQSERIIREAGNPGRRTFRTRGALESWVGELLDAQERARLAQFLAECDMP